MTRPARSQCDCGRFVQEKSVYWTRDEDGNDEFGWYCTKCGYQTRKYGRDGQAQ